MENEAYLYYQSKFDEVTKLVTSGKTSVFILAPRFAELKGILQGLHFAEAIPTYMYITLSNELMEYWNKEMMK